MTSLDTYTPIYTQFCTEVVSNKASEDYGRLGATPKLQEWKAERAPKQLLEQ